MSGFSACAGRPPIPANAIAASAIAIAVRMERVLATDALADAEAPACGKEATIFVTLRKLICLALRRAAACGRVAGIPWIFQARFMPLVANRAFCSADVLAGSSQHSPGGIEFREGREWLVIVIP